MSEQIELINHQYEFLADEESRFLALVGGYACGKTYAFCLKTIFLAARNIGFQGAIMEPTFPMVKRVLVPSMTEAIRATGVKAEYYKGDAYYDFHFQEGSTRVWLLSAENYDRMNGMNLAFFGVDECDKIINKEVARSMWYQAMSRLRSGNVYQGFTTSTPEGFNFLYEFFQEEPESDPKLRNLRRMIKGRTADNPNIPKDFIQSLLDTYPPNLIKSYLEGEFTNLTSGQIYYAFDRQQNHTDKTLQSFTANHILHIGVDFNIGKMAAVVHVIDNNIPYAVDEIMGVRNTESLIRELKERYSGRPIVLYPDASGNQNKTSAAMSDIAMFHQAGFKTNIPNKNPNVKDRINSMNAAFCSASGIRKYFVNTKQCSMYTKALEQQVYLNGQPDKKHDKDHPNDAAGYFIHRIYPLQGKATATVY